MELNYREQNDQKHFVIQLRFLVYQAFPFSLHSLFLYQRRQCDR